jgi:hypothetical protein
LSQIESIEPPLWLFSAFEPGLLIGKSELTFDEVMLHQWESLYGPLKSKGMAPLGSVPLLLMRAFATIITPRPAGNLHVGQQCILHRLPKIGAKMLASASCASKEEKHGRKVVQFAVDITDSPGGNLMITGTTTIFWAQ